MAGLLDFLLGQGGGGLLGQMQGGQPQPQPMPQQGYGTGYMNADTGGLLGSFRGALNQIANPQGLQQAYEQKDNVRAGNALLSALPGGQQQQPAPPLAPGMSPIPAQQGNLPRGLRNNNPLNIEAGTFTQGQPGYQGSDGRFAQFASMDHGIAAANGLLDTYQKQYGLNTVGGIIGRWAPPGENDTRGYAASVAGRLGVSPDQPLTPEQRPALIAAMAQFENGRPLPAQSAPAGGVMSPALGYGADAGKSGGLLQMPAGMPPAAPQGAPPPSPQPAQAVPMDAPQPPAVPPQAPQGPRQAMAGSNLTLLDSPALQGMPDTVRRALPAMLASKQYQPQAMAMIQKYINPEQWQMYRDAQGNVITRNTATGESKPLISATPDMQNAAASGLPTPLAYNTAQEFGKVAAQNTALTPEQKNANASGGMSPFQFENAKIIAKVSAENNAMVPEQKLYQQAQAQGFVGTEMQFQAERARLLKQGQVSAEDHALTTTQKDAKASGGLTPLQFDTAKSQDAKLGEMWVKKYETATEAGVNAHKQLPQLALVKNIVATDPNFFSGIGENYNLALKKIGVAIGLDPNMSASQEIVGKVLSDQIATGLRTAFGGLGQVRVAELNVLQQSLASKGNSPEALKALVTIAMKTQQRAADIAEIAQNYDNGSGRLNAGYDRAVTEYDKTHPFLSPEEIANYKKIADAGAPGTPKPQTANPYEAEARRRGLIK